MSTIDYEQLQWRLIGLLPVDRAFETGLAVGQLIEHLRFLDVAVEDYDHASTELQEVLWATFGNRVSRAFPSLSPQPDNTPRR